MRDSRIDGVDRGRRNTTLANLRGRPRRFRLVVTLASQVGVSKRSNE
jgi:hypothetical protein